ncbi:MAG: phosphoribosylanthranilate isomerase, partial [Candidatus Saccharimonas aalborgensis]
PYAQHVRQIIKKFPEGVDSFLVTHLTEADDILSLANYIQSSGIQVSEDIDENEMAAVRKGTERKIIKTIVTSDPEATRKLTIYEPYCDFFLLDSRVAGYTGGTGGENDWRACAELIKRTSKPVFIAGGLRPDNVEAAMVLTKPYGTDVSTGVSCYSDSYLRKDRKDLSKIAEFIRISKAFDEQ